MSGTFYKTLSGLLLPLLFLVFSSSGCSLIGFAVGAAHDNSSQPAYEHKDMAELGSGDKIRILRRKSAAIEGIYKRLEPLDSSTYAARYAEFLNRIPTTINPPNYGDTLFSTSEDKGNLYVFRGYNTRGWDIEKLPTHARGTIISRSFSLLKRQDGIPIDYDALQQMAAKGLLPLNESIVVDSTEVELKIPLNDVTYVGKLKPRNEKWIGLAAGLGVDALAIAVIVSLHNAFDFSGMNLEFQ